MDPPLPSLLLQVALYFTGWYLVLLYISEIALLVYKGLALPYPTRNFWPELLLLLMLAGLDMIRIFFGVKGNLTRRKIPLLVSLIFLFPIFFGYLYLILWQTYVFVVELVTLIIAFVGIALELVLGPLALWMIHRYSLLR